MPTYEELINKILVQLSDALKKTNAGPIAFAELKNIFLQIPANLEKTNIADMLFIPSIYINLAQQYPTQCYPQLDVETATIAITKHIEAFKQNEAEVEKIQIQIGKTPTLTESDISEQSALIATLKQVSHHIAQIRTTIELIHNYIRILESINLVMKRTIDYFRPIEHVCAMENYYVAFDPSEMKGIVHSLKDMIAGAEKELVMFIKNASTLPARDLAILNKWLVFARGFLKIKSRCIRESLNIRIRHTGFNYLENLQQLVDLPPNARPCSPAILYYFIHSALLYQIRDNGLIENETIPSLIEAFFNMINNIDKKNEMCFVDKLVSTLYALAHFITKPVNIALYLIQCLRKIKINDIIDQIIKQPIQTALALELEKIDSKSKERADRLLENRQHRQQQLLLAPPPVLQPTTSANGDKIEDDLFAASSTSSAKKKKSKSTKKKPKSQKKKIAAAVTAELVTQDEQPASSTPKNSEHSPRPKPKFPQSSLAHDESLATIAASIFPPAKHEPNKDKNDDASFIPVTSGRRHKKLPQQQSIPSASATAPKPNEVTIPPQKVNSKKEPTLPKQQEKNQSPPASIEITSVKDKAPAAAKKLAIKQAVPPQPQQKPTPKTTAAQAEAASSFSSTRSVSVAELPTSPSVTIKQQISAAPAAPIVTQIDEPPPQPAIMATKPVPAAAAAPTVTSTSQINPNAIRIVLQNIKVTSEAMQPMLMHIQLIIEFARTLQQHFPECKIKLSGGYARNLLIAYYQLPYQMPTPSDLDLEVALPQETTMLEFDKYLKAQNFTPNQHISGLYTYYADISLGRNAFPCATDIKIISPPVSTTIPQPCFHIDTLKISLPELTHNFSLGVPWTAFTWYITEYTTTPQKRYPSLRNIIETNPKAIFRILRLSLIHGLPESHYLRLIRALQWPGNQLNTFINFYELKSEVGKLLTRGYAHQLLTVYRYQNHKNILLNTLQPLFHDFYAVMTWGMDPTQIPTPNDMLNCALQQFLLRKFYEIDVTPRPLNIYKIFALFLLPKYVVNNIYHTDTNFIETTMTFIADNLINLAPHLKQDPTKTTSDKTIKNWLEENGQKCTKQICCFLTNSYEEFQVVLKIVMSSQPIFMQTPTVLAPSQAFFQLAQPQQLLPYDSGKAPAPSFT